MKTVSDIENILGDMPDKSSAALLIVKTKDGSNEFKKEKGEWIENLSAEIKAFNLTECRNLWNSAHFYSDIMSCPELEAKLTAMLSSKTHPELDSYLLVSELQGNSDNKLREMENMQLQLLKLDYWNEHIYDYYYFNGAKVELLKT